MIQVIGIRVGSDFFLAHKEPDLVKAQHKLGKISAQKIFPFGLSMTCYH